jgi:tetratricopeptide (TPR) repeat protein
MTDMDYKRALLQETMTEQDLFNKGMEFYKNKNYQQAINYFEKGYKMKDADTSICYAICLYKGKGIKQNKEKAIGILDKCRHLVKDDEICYRIIGDYYYKKTKLLIQKTFGNIDTVSIESIFNGKIPMDIEKYILGFTKIQKNSIQINTLLENTMTYYDCIINCDPIALKKHNECVLLYQKINNRLPFKNPDFF